MGFAWSYEPRGLGPSKPLVIDVVTLGGGYLMPLGLEKMKAFWKPTGQPTTLAIYVFEGAPSLLKVLKIKIKIQWSPCGA